MAETHLQGVEISATQFLEIWRHYDTDGNGYIEGKELQNFIQELQQARKKAGLELSDKMKAFVEQYGQNSDGKIGIVEKKQEDPAIRGITRKRSVSTLLDISKREALKKHQEERQGGDNMISNVLAQILPTEENFLLFFRQQLKSSEEFMQIWRRYDTDHSGYIETEELKSFLKDLLKKANKPFEESKLEEYTQTMLRMFDSNNDGKLGLTEMARLLPVQENFLLKFQNVKMCGKEFNKAFELYDKDGSGYIDENELDALLKDLCEKDKKELDINSISTYKKSIMALSDGGKLYRTELALVLCADEN